MSSLLGLLRTGYRGVAAQRLLTEVAGQNIANASTPGYRRQQALLTTMPTVPGANVGGVRVLGLQQSRDAFLQREMVSTGGSLGREQAMRETLETLEPYLNDVEGNGLGAALDRLFSGFERLTADPDSLALRGEILSGGAELANRIRQVAGAIDSLQADVNRQLRDEVAAANDSLAGVASLNQEIAIREGAGEDASALRDARDALVRNLAGTVGTEAVVADDGSTTLLVGGRAIVQGERSGELRVETSPGESQPQVVVALDDGAGSVTAVGGRLGGLLAARDEVAGQARDDLDQFAFDLARTVNTVHESGFGLDGEAGRPFFTRMLTVDGAASQLELSAVLAGAPERLAAASELAGIPGGNETALALASIASQATFGGGSLSPSEALGQISNDVARRLADARSEESAQRMLLERVEALHASRTGVSIEEEMVNLTASQRALEASARTVKAADEMLQTVLRLI